MDEKQPLEILSQFGVSGAGIRLERLTQGYINDTFRVHTPKGNGFILQRINATVFPLADLLMQNLEQVLPALKAPEYQNLELHRTSEGRTFVKDAEGSLWRVFQYIPDSSSFQNPETPQIASEAGRIVAAFHTLVRGIPPDSLQITLPGFHYIDKRYAQLTEALSEARPDRLQKSAALLRQAEALSGFCQAIPFSELRLRVCHNDTKLSNILFNTHTGKALCLIDLDTLMPGYLLYDFGDAARGMLHPESEDGKVTPGTPADLQLFKTFITGWKSSGLPMQPVEIKWLCHGVVLMPSLHGIRALTDYLMGDRYYKVAYPEQNLDRAGRLLATAQSAQKALGQMQELVQKLWA